MDNAQKTLLQIVTHRRQNPLDFKLSCVQEPSHTTGYYTEYGVKILKWVFLIWGSQNHMFWPKLWKR
jgi:hypothetical protein